MAITRYSELQSEALDWMDRFEQSGKAAAWIELAEARLNRRIGDVEQDVTLTGTADSRSIDLSSLSVTTPVALFLAETGADEVEIGQQADGTFPYLSTSGRPTKWAVDGDSIDFDCPLDAAYPFRFRYAGRLALSDDAPTNWLLDNHPDIYLAATLMWGAGYNQDWSNGQVWKAALDEGIPEVVRMLAKKKRALLMLDPALAQFSAYGIGSLAQFKNGDF